MTSMDEENEELDQEGESSETTSLISSAVFEAFQNPSNRDDQVFSAISGNGELKVTAATTRNAVNDLMIQHTMTAVPADALGRAITCSLLLSNGIQAEQTFQLTLNCDGPLRVIVAIANGEGGVRGYVGNPGIGDMPLPEAIGKGTVQVVKNHPDWPNPYNGITAIEHRDIDRDVGIYLAESEQRSCALAAATTVKGILCTSSGGYIVEQLPGCSSETIQRVEKNLAQLAKRDGTGKLPAGLLADGVTPLEICSIVLDGLDMEPLGQIKPELVCKCSEERLFRAVRLLGKEEVDDIIAKAEEVEARCQFCGKVYRMGPTELAKSFAEAKGDPSKDSDFEENSK
eukprot:CAMPEP_0197830160 /NCGR_PEP_ID=MMETSP1437-20131217/6766_1 /TAXON_ID=49252 ORGANISM="Eucampia antarctica, Strain CCMP1452" /NCGR_SAMPLE_ID=MMETSP1437 /ASSEMBLY_ACC=CAM_ASM_001096 /LENGTH=342 /DNA_ID=CAMNT_0043432363 /DNA_START=299 /DNA_END=1327 /DNA_ORIENTATION=-